MFKCESCGIDVSFFNIRNMNRRANSPMLKNIWWKKVCDYYGVSFESTHAICDKCMEVAIGELTKEKLRHCMITEEWKNPNLETYKLSNEELIRKCEELGLTETEDNEE